MAKKDGERRTLIIVAGLFSLALIGTWIYGADILGVMFNQDWAFATTVLAATILCVYSWYRALKGFDDPNQDHWRWVILVLAIIAIVILGPYKAQHRADVSDHITATETRGP